MMFLLQGLFLSMLIGVANVQAVAWDQENKVEVTSHWEPYLKSQNQNEEFDRYIAVLLDITELDAEVANQIATISFEQDQWRGFVQKKDLNTTLALIECMTFVLQRTVWDECALRFPLQLTDIAQDMQKSGLSQEEYLTKVRRAFLAFTFIVSRMDEVINFDQLA